MMMRPQHDVVYGGATMGGMSLPKVLILQHVPWEKPGRILANLDELGLQTDIRNIAKEKKPELPDFDDLAGVVIMGGPMGAEDYDKYPGLKIERKLAKACVAAGKPILGVCLGHQIIGVALGGKLKSGKVRELGFAPIERKSKHTFFSMWSEELDVLNWHFDTVTLPPDAQLLASSQYTDNQAFALGSALGLQFHLEVSPLLFEEWMATPEMTADLKKSQIKEMKDRFVEADAQLKPLSDAVFSGFAARCLTYGKSIAKPDPKPEGYVELS